MKKQHAIPPIVLFIILVLYYLISSNGGKNVPQTGGTSSNPSTSGGTTSNPAAPQSNNVPAAPQSNANHVFGKQTKTTGCESVNALPDSACTPGAILETDVSKICQQGYASSVRNVPTSEKDQVYAEYGIASHSPGQYEVDHLVSLELGGSNDISNLWPEPASPVPGFHEKDKVENYLHDQVCAGKMSLQDAQIQIATNWLAVYNQMQK